MARLFLMISVSVLLLPHLFGCATIPNEVKHTISDQKLAGYWATPKGSWDKESYLKIDCDGTIEYRIQDEALILKDNKDEGKIKKIADGQIIFKSWVGLSWTDAYTPPTLNKDGCWTISYKGMRLASDGPIDCLLPKRSLLEVLNDAVKREPSRCLK